MSAFALSNIRTCAGEVPHECEGEARKGHEHAASGPQEQGAAATGVHEELGHPGSEHVHGGDEGRAHQRVVDDPRKEGLIDRWVDGSIDRLVDGSVDQ